MCGIVGALWAGPPERGRAIVAAMNRAIVHRGPDDDGLWAGVDVAFGMRRLAIIDLAGGRQPIWSGDGVGIVFNGEIYNYRALRDELEADGFRFTTRSDTEVILHLYRRDGLAAIQRLEGMFAICLYDSRQKVLHLVRDRLGVKPLYYCEGEGCLFFASEIKAILAGLSARPALDLAAVHHYLTLRFVPGPETVWQGIRKLPPAHVLTVDLARRRLRLERYWRLRFQAEPLEQGRDYVQEFAERFLAAVEKRLLASDVPVGVLLSGGLDSSAVSAAAVELGHRRFHTFSVAFADRRAVDETPYARAVARHIGSLHHEVRIGRQEFVDFLPAFVRFADEPLADLASVPLYYVSRLARSHVKVVLSGEGSDEILAGYTMERFARMLDMLRQVERWLPPRWLAPAARLLPQSSALGQRLTAFAAGGWQGFFAALGMHMTSYWSEEEKDGLWRAGSPLRASSTLDRIRSWYDEARGRHPLDQILQVYCRQWLVEDLLMKADKMSMAVSLELREPFLDHPLVEWAARLPLAWRVGDRRSGPVSKRILREFARRRLPAAILSRPKQGFPVPAYRWLQEDLGHWAEEMLTGKEARVAELFHRKPMRAVVARACRGEEQAAHKTWILLILEHWLREWQ